MPVELVDTHCHLDFDRFDADRDEVIGRAENSGVARIVVPGITLATSQQICEMAQRILQVYAAVGIHPNDLQDAGEIGETLAAIRKLAKSPKVVAIGEIGLDYYWKKAPNDAQAMWLKRQLAIASEVELPVILHNRESTADLLSIVSEWVSAGLPDAIANRPGVVHSFSGSWQDAQAFLDLGFYIGFTGPLTYKNADEMREVAAKAPADRILIETDAPFLTPIPHRGKRNEPAYVRHVAEKLAEVRSIDLAAAAQITTQNAARLFGADRLFG